MTDRNDPQHMLTPQPREHWVSPDHPQLILLRNWQVERLARTYADLRATRRYGLACDFFLSDIYSPTHFSEYRHDLDRIYRLMPQALPDYIVNTTAMTLELYHLTDELDQALLRALVAELGMTDSLTAELYAQAYRVCDNYDERAHQIDLIVRVAAGVGRLATLARVPLILRLTRVPAKLAGWSDIHSFLARGLVAYKQMEEADFFFHTIYEREMRILDRIFAHDPDPFSI